MQGYEAAVQIDGKVYDLQTLTTTAVSNEGAKPILFYTRIKNTNSPILIEVTLQDSVRYKNIAKFAHFKYMLNIIFYFQSINIKVKSTDNGDVLLSSSTNYPSHFNQPHVTDSSCKINKKSDFVCRIVLCTENAAIFQVQSGNFFFIPQNSLPFQIC